MSHNYNCQVQGQMGVVSRPWCDFVLYTRKGLTVEGINFDSEFWNDKLVRKLEEFYTKCFLPEVVSLVHVLGLPQELEETIIFIVIHTTDSIICTTHTITITI